MTKNPQYYGKAKHIAIKYHFIREHVSNGTVTLQYCPTEEMMVYMFIKVSVVKDFVSYNTWLELFNSLIGMFKSEEEW